MTATAGRLLTRGAEAAAPVRQVHLGLGNFFRAHQAVYTHQAPDADAWGIAAFTGRSPGLATAMSSQDGLYTLITHAPDGDSFEVIDSVCEAHAAGDHRSWLRLMSAAETAVLTVTVTEAAYLRGEDGGLDQDHRLVTDDVEALQHGLENAVHSVPGRVVAALAARRAAGSGPIAVVPCDNISQNGSAVSRVVTQLAERTDPSLADWITGSVSFVSTVVDRITPRTSPADVRSVEQGTGVRDRCPVVTESFTEWVLHGDFPGGRPSWEAAGAVLVDDVTPFEQRKIWLLNGAHSLLAYVGSIRGHTTVSEAVSDAACRSWMQRWWSEASPHLGLPETEVAAYQSALLDRFANPAMHHRLDQIAADGSQKLPVRTLPVLTLERSRGRVPLGATQTLAAWVLHLRGMGAPVTDAQRDEVVALASGPLFPAVQRVLTFLDPEIGADIAVTTAVLAQAEELARS